MANRLLALLARPRAPLTAALVGIALTLPALGVGILGDDYIHRSILLGVGGAGAGAQPLFDLFAFVPMGPRREAAVTLGTLTWWTHPEISVALFRPLAVLTHMLDYEIWPDLFLLQHLHSLLWYGLAVFAVAAFYRRIHGATAVAGLAAILFAVEDAHALCAGWLANRHALVALVFGVFALHAHHRWRRGSPAWSAGAVAAFAVSLLCSEAALGAAAYIVAWQLTMEDVPWTRCLAPLVPYGLLVVAWRIVYETLGYGTHGSALYVDPGRHPVDFLVALAERWPMLQLAQWFQFPVDVFLIVPRVGQIGLVVFSAAVCLLLIRVFKPLLAERREARFWATGMSLALVPLCAAFPMDRLLLFSGVGAFGLMALLAEHSGLLPGRDATGARSRGRSLARVLLVLHGPVAALLLVGRVATMPLFAELFEAGAVTAPADENAPRQTFVFVNGSEFPVVYLVIIRQLESPDTAPQRVALLGSTATHNLVYREDADTLVITARGGFLRDTVDQLMRSLDVPFRVGERIKRRDFTAEVRTVTPDGRPEAVAFHFRAPLESPEFRWLAWGEAGAEAFPLPAVGTQVELPPVGLLPMFAPPRAEAGSSK